jgi:hypothetical protein
MQALRRSCGRSRSTLAQRRSRSAAEVRPQDYLPGNFVASVDCAGETPWSTTVRSDQGAFGRGYVEV